MLRSTLRKLTCNLFAGATLTLSASAFATPVMPGDQVEVANRAGNAFTPAPVAGDSNGLYRGVTFELDGARSVRAAAGMFVLDYRATDTGWHQFYTFCLEPDVYLTPFANPYTVRTLGGSGYNAAIGELWGRYRSRVTNDTNAAAFQVALWELAYDGDRSLTGGSFQLVRAHQAVRDTAASWLQSLDGTGPSGRNLRVFGSNPGLNDRQDLITEVPEPGGLALAALSLLLLRRRK